MIFTEREFSSDVTDECMCGVKFLLMSWELRAQYVCKSRGPKNFETSYFGGGLELGEVKLGRDKQNLNSENVSR